MVWRFDFSKHCLEKSKRQTKSSGNRDINKSRTQENGRSIDQKVHSSKQKYIKTAGNHNAEQPRKRTNKHQPIHQSRKLRIRDTHKSENQEIKRMENMKTVNNNIRKSITHGI